MSKIKYSPKSLRTGHATIEELVDSIRAKGLLQPIVVRPKDAHFEIVAGNRRCKACEVLRWKKITCHVVNLDDKQAFEASLIENIQRNPCTYRGGPSIQDIRRRLWLRRSFGTCKKNR
jgi:ParB family chromosome partitioning protein